MRQGWIVGALLVLAAEASASFDSGLALAQDKQDAATLSFAQNHSGSYPRSISGDQTMRVDLSALPPGVTIHRAVLRPGRVDGEAFTHRDVPLKVLVEGKEQPLKLLGPRFTSFDVTAEV